jgi:hypothetical protein
MKFLSNKLIVQYDTTNENLLISHPSQNEFPQPLVTIRPETYASMNFNQLSEFLGARLLLLMPEMRKHFKDHIERLSSPENGKVESDRLGIAQRNPANCWANNGLSVIERE